MESKLRKAGFSSNTSYELFILGVSLLSFLNLVLLMLPLSVQANDVIFSIDKITAVIFLFDFTKRLTMATNKRGYFFKHRGWMDLLAAVPITAFNIFRLFRVLRFVRALRIIGPQNLLQLLKKNLADTALYGVFFAILLLLEFGSIAILAAEEQVQSANIKSASDAMWWVFVSITTVGYGDRYPVTDSGRLVGVATLTVGVGLFGVVTGYIANIFLGRKST
jgi:voltage-gated potassium channel